MRATHPLGLSRRVRARLLVALLLVALAAVAWDAAALWRALGWNRVIAQQHARAEAGETTRRAPEALPPEVRFAIAGEQAAAGDGPAALDGWRALQADTPLGRTARFNAANALLREAERLRAGQQPGQAIALVELAKESLRELLRQDPGHWAARYNLERAQRLQPDADEADTAPAAAPRDAERAATTARGVAQGLP
jgi:mxaK protein